MTDFVEASMPPALAEKVGAGVAIFLSGRIDVGNNSFLLIPEEIGWTTQRMAGFARITPTKDVRIERVGMLRPDVFLDFIDVFPNGTIQVEVKRFGFRIRKDV